MARSPWRFKATQIDVDDEKVYSRICEYDPMVPLTGERRWLPVDPDPEDVADALRALESHIQKTKGKIDTLPSRRPNEGDVLYPVVVYHLTEDVSLGAPTRKTVTKRVKRIGELAQQLRSALQTADEFSLTALFSRSEDHRFGVNRKNIMGLLYPDPHGGEVGLIEELEGLEAAAGSYAGSRAKGGGRGTVLRRKTPELDLVAACATVFDRYSSSVVENPRFEEFVIITLSIATNGKGDISRHYIKEMVKLHKLHKKRKAALESDPSVIRYKLDKLQLRRANLISSTRAVGEVEPSAEIFDRSGQVDLLKEIDEEIEALWKKLGDLD